LTAAITGRAKRKARDRINRIVVDAAHRGHALRTEFREIQAGAERAAGARQHHHTQGGVVGQQAQRGHQLAAQ
jgi:hypothetical protein